jgi:hypothetical protein
MTNTAIDLWVPLAIIRIPLDILILWQAILNIEGDTDIVSELEQALPYPIEVGIYTIFIA